MNGVGSRIIVGVLLFGCSSLPRVRAEEEAQKPCSRMLQNENVSRKWVESQIVQNQRLTPDEERLQTTLRQNGFSSAAFNEDILKAHDPTYTFELNHAYSNSSSGRELGWIFSGLEMTRQGLQTRLKLPHDFELSHNYILFFTLIERANTQIEDLIARMDQKLQPATLRQWATPNLSVNGSFSTFYEIALKYGVAPKSVMPPTVANDYEFAEAIEEAERALADFSLRYLGVRKRIEAYFKGRLKRDIHPDYLKRKRQELRREKTRAMEAVWSILARHLGNPQNAFEIKVGDFPEPPGEKETNAPIQSPARLAFDARESSAARVSVSESVRKQAKQLFEDSGLMNESWVTLGHYPQKPFGQLYEIKNSSAVTELWSFLKMPLRILNLPFERIQSLLVESLEAGFPVPVFLNTAIDSDDSTGLLHTELYRREGLYPSSVQLARVDRATPEELAYLGLNPHSGAYAVIRGYDQPDESESIRKFKVQVTRSTRFADRGSMHMYLNWMHHHAFQFVVPKRLLSEGEQKALDATPIQISMGEMSRR